MTGFPKTLDAEKTGVLDLDGLIAPVESTAFFRDWWEKAILEIRRNASDYYANLMTGNDIEQIITFTRPVFVDANAFRPGAPRSASYVQGWPAGSPQAANGFQPDFAAVRRVFAEGKTVVIRAMQERCPAIAYFCRRLEAVFRCPVHANLYWTPEGAQGFDAHYDTHEVFVLQLEGTKTWRLYGPGRSLPLVDEKLNVPKDQLGSPREVSLGPGDLLYLPRGFVHEAFTAESASLHLTVGVNVYRWADLLREALADLTDRDERLRESVPPACLGEARPSEIFLDRFRSTLRILADEANMESALRRLNDRFFDHLRTLPNPRRDPAPQEKALTLDTEVEKNPNAICRVLREGAWVALEYPGGRIGGPAKIASSLEFIADRERFPIRALPDDLSGDSKLVLVGRMLKDGLLTVATRSVAASEIAGKGPRTADPDLSDS